MSLWIRRHPEKLVRHMATLESYERQVTKTVEEQDKSLILFSTDRGNSQCVHEFARTLKLETYKVNTQPLWSSIRTKRIVPLILH